MYDCSEFSQAFFEEASQIWKKNKVRTGQAMYRYKKNAFPKDLNEPPAWKLSTKKAKELEKELEKRQAIDEYAPPRIRRSPRLREKEFSS